MNKEDSVFEMIAFYSRAGENYVSGEIRDLELGNTEFVATAMKKLIDANMFKIEPKIPYARDYSRCIQQALSDQRKAYRPELICYPENLAQYKTIYLGFPNYWGTMPMPVFTFLERCDLSGKTIKLFCTHEGDGFGRSKEDVERICPRALVETGPAIRGARLLETDRILKQWLCKGADSDCINGIRGK